MINKHTHTHTRPRAHTHTHTHTHPHTHKHTHTHTHTLLHVINTSHTHAAHVTPELPYDLLVDVFVDDGMGADALCSGGRKWKARHVDPNAPENSSCSSTRIHNKRPPAGVLQCTVCLFVAFYVGAVFESGRLPCSTHSA